MNQNPDRSGFSDVGTKVAGAAIIIGVFTILSGCASQVPLISHTHIGHSLTGWVDTPNKAGLFETSEEYAERIVDVSKKAEENAAAGNVEAVGKNMAELESLIGSNEEPSSDAYSFLRAFIGAREHIEFAIQSDDVSTNLAQAGQSFLENSEGVLVRAEVMKAVAQTPLEQATVVDVVNEVRALAEQNFSGDDADGDGVIGSSPEEYGLILLRTELAQALTREKEPAYRPVEQRYLFGLVRLPDGTWKFRSVYEGSGGGGGGDGGGGY